MAAKKSIHLFTAAFNRSKPRFDRKDLFCYDEISPSSKSQSRKATLLNRESLAGNGLASPIGKEKTMQGTLFFLINVRLRDHD
jgi:hypothetical protein